MTSPARAYRYYDLFVAGFVAVLLCSNLIGPAKVALVGGVAFGVGNIYFPASYIFGDVLTEVYGYARARRAIWAGFAGLVFAAGMTQSVIHMPADPAEPFNEVLQPALVTVFDGTGRIVVASMLAFVIGDFVNSYVMARLKVLTNGRYLWVRTIGSTVLGQGVDSLVFYPVAFAGIWNGDKLLEVSLTNWLIKVGIEVAMTPVTYVVVGWLKRAEREDYFDRDTDFSPFHLNT